MDDQPETAQVAPNQSDNTGPTLASGINHEPIASPTQPQPAQATNQLPDNITLDNVAAGYTSFILKHWWLAGIILIVSIVIAIKLLVVGIFILMIALIVSQTLYEKSLFKAFANSNHFDFQKKADLTNQTGLIFTIGHAREFSDIVSGRYADSTFMLFLYEYTIGYGRSSQSFHRAVMSIKYNQPLPAFVLRRHSFFQILEEEGESLRSHGYTEKINLEGDFNRHFQVFIRPDSQIDVLSILTPDVMQMLIGLDKYEIEATQEGNFYIYCKNYISKKQQLVDVYKILETVKSKIDSYVNREEIMARNDPTPITPQKNIIAG